MEDEEFRAGAIDIQWLERRLSSLLGAEPTPDELRAAAIAAAHIADAERLGRMPGPDRTAAAGPRTAAPSVARGGTSTTASWAHLARVESLRDR
jgi:hypothetical protein